MAEFTQEELREKILSYLHTVDKAKNKDVAKAIGADKKACDKVINELAREGELEFLYLGTSYVKINGK